MAIQLKSADEVAAQQGVKLLIYGRAGTGKTGLCATAPYPVVISAEAGVLSLKKDNIERMFGVATKGITYTIPVIEVDTLDKLKEIYTWAEQAQEAKQFHTLCIDSLSEIAEKVFTNAQYQISLQKKGDPRQAYSLLLDQMIVTVKNFRDLKGKHVYMTSKEAKVKDDITGVTMLGPAMPGAKLGPDMPYRFDEVLHIGIERNFQTQQAYRYLRTRPDFNVQAKDRSGALDEIEYPHLGMLFNKIMGAQYYPV